MVFYTGLIAVCFGMTVLVYSSSINFDLISLKFTTLNYSQQLLFLTLLSIRVSVSSTERISNPDYGRVQRGSTWGYRSVEGELRGNALGMTTETEKSEGSRQGPSTRVRKTKICDLSEADLMPPPPALSSASLSWEGAVLFFSHRISVLACFPSCLHYSAMHLLWR